MAEINVEMLKDKLYPVAKALFVIGETLVDVSKHHISAEDAIDKIRTSMYDADVICSRYRVDRLIEECMEPQVYNWFEDYGKTYLKVNGLDYPDCCDSCSNNPKNGGSGICNCTLPYMQNPTIYNVSTTTDDCCMASNVDRKTFIVNKDFLDNIPKMSSSEIEASIERIKKYIKE